MASPFTANLVGRIAAVQRQIDGAAWGATGAAVVGVAENNAVRVHLRDDGRATTVEIDPNVVDPDRVAQLERFVAEAVQDASDRLGKLRADRVTVAIRALIDDLFVPVVREEL